MINGRHSWRRIGPRGWSAVVLVGGWAIFWAKLIFSSGVPFDRDILLTTLPLRQFMRERLLSGHWPGWYPYELLGVPFAGNIVTSPFHPQTLLYLLLSPSVANKWRLLIGSLLGVVGAYRFARVEGASRPAAVTAAYVFGFGGYAVSITNNPTFFIPLMTAPWLLAAAIRMQRRHEWRDVAALAISGALVFLGGDAQLFLEGGLVVAVLMAFGRHDAKRLLRYGMGGALAMCLIACELLPAISVAGESIRTLWQADASRAIDWAFHPLRLADFVIPRFVPFDWTSEVGAALEAHAGLFASTVFVGGAALLLMVSGAIDRRRAALPWGIVSVIGLWLAMGSFGGLLPIWWKVLPLFARFRFPEKYVALTVLAAIPLVAWGVDAAVRSPRPMMRLALGVGGVLLLVGVISEPATLIHWANQLAGSPHPFRGAVAQALGRSWSSGLWQTGVELLAVAGALFFVKDARALPIIVLVALRLGNDGRVPLASPEIVDDPGAFAAELRQRQSPNEPPVRVMSLRGGRLEKSLTPEERVRAIHLWLVGDDAGRGHVTAWYETNPAESERALSLLRDVMDERFWRERLNLCFRVTENPGGEELVATNVNPALSLTKMPCGPRAWLASEALPVDDESIARDHVKAGLPEGAVVWEGGPAITGGGGTVTWRSADADALQLDVDAAAASALVVGDAISAGWSATVDGHPTPIHPTDGALRGVAVPAGRHVVEMTYRVPGLRLGVIISLFGIMLCALAILCTDRGRRGLVRPA